jgi:hypothetical protein
VYSLVYVTVNVTESESGSEIVRNLAESIALVDTHLIQTRAHGVLTYCLGVAIESVSETRSESVGHELLEALGNNDLYFVI